MGIPVDELRRIIREHPELVLDVLRDRPEVILDALARNADTLVTLILGRPEVLTKVLVALFSLPLNLLLNLARAMFPTAGSYGDLDSLRARLGDVENAVSRIEGSMVTKADLERLMREFAERCMGTRP
jgi:hypothetical protein